MLINVNKEKGGNKIVNLKVREKEDLKKAKGITLIALVVTIIILVILAGVTINMTISENGIITIANQAKVKTENAVVYENLALKVLDLQWKDGSDSGIGKEMQLLQEGGYIDSNAIVNVIKTVGQAMSTGKGSGSKDVYKVEEGILYYYTDKEEKISLGNLFTGKKEETDSSYFDFDETTGTITLKDISKYYGPHWITDVNFPLSTIVIPEKINGKEVKIIGRIVARNIKNIILPKTVVKIEEEAFYRSSDLENVSMQEGITEIGSNAFAETALKSITIPNGITSLNYAVFSGCYKLTEINLPSTLTEIRGGAFRNCTALTEITIPKSVTSIGVEAFARCTSLMTIMIPKSVTSIGERAFFYCDSLTEIIIEQGSTLDIDANRWGAPEGCVITKQ